MGKPTMMILGVTFSGSRDWIGLSEHELEGRGFASLWGAFYLPSSVQDLVSFIFAIYLLTEQNSPVHHTQGLRSDLGSSYPLPPCSFPLSHQNTSVVAAPPPPCNHVTVSEVRASLPFAELKSVSSF